MKIKILASMLAGALAMLPVTANAGWGGGEVGAYGSPITIYGWQYHSFESIEKNKGSADEKDYTEVRSNAANIGFLGFIDTGIEGVKMTWRCENFTYLGDFAGGTGWCNRNSKIGISGAFGEIMMATWLLPYNEMVAQWVDPFYDAGNLSHTGIMGNIGTSSGIFYNTGIFDDGDNFGDFKYSTADFGGTCTKTAGQCYGDYGSFGLGFNRRQEGIVQYMGTFDKVSFRFAFTQGERDETTTTGGSGATKKVDPVIYSTGVAYSDGPIWLAVTYQKHEDWTAAKLGTGAAANAMLESDAESFRIAGRYIADLGGGASLTLSAMWENLEYEFKDAVAEVTQRFGFSDAAFGDITAGTNLKIDRDAFLISGKYATGGPLNFRFMYAQADDYDTSGTFASGQNNRQSDSGADMLALGVYYSLGDSTEIGLTYNEVDNDTYGAYGTGIGGVGNGGINQESEMIALNVITMF